tara:strand:+ start:459 stop:764 length:306 start_codon:yes stop_codon:yes gene_type:complete
MDIKVNVSENKRQVSLYLEVKMNNQSGKYKSIDAQNWLQEKGYKVGRPLKHDVVENRDEEEKLCKGHWTFELRELPVQKNVKKPAVVRQKTKMKVQKEIEE